MVGLILDGRYRVLEKIGQGGMGEVYLAEHVHLGRREALKVLHPVLAAQAEFVSRFRREARAINRLQHPNIVTIHDFGRLPDGKFYLAMELAEGLSLASVIAREGRLSVPRAVYVLSQLAHAVEHAHSRGVVHRDLKPENLFLVEHRGRPDHLKVVDFGIAKIVAHDYQESFGGTPSGEIMGTPAYMAPEQLRGAGADPRSDLYAVGCIAFEMLTGETPFFGRKMELMHAHLTKPAPRPGERRPEAQIPHALDELVLMCMQKDPARRFQTGRDLAVALETVPGFGSHPPSTSKRRAAALSGFEVPDTSERHFSNAPSGDAATGRLTRDELRAAMRDAVRRLAEVLVDDGHSDLGLVIGTARAHQLDDELKRHDADSQRLDERALELEQAARDREASLRFALGELRFERENRTASGQPLDSEMELQIADFEARIVACGGELKTQLDALMDQSIALAAARADVEEQLDEVCHGLERVLDELLPSLDGETGTRSLASHFLALRDLARRVEPLA